jgi:hypothetical protein
VNRAPAADTVTVTLAGSPAAVIALARALTTVTAVTGMSHHVEGDTVIRIDATCHHPTRRGTT